MDIGAAVVLMQRTRIRPDKQLASQGTTRKKKNGKSLALTLEDKIQLARHWSIPST